MRQKRMQRSIMYSLLDNEEEEEVNNLQFTDEPGRRRRSSKKLKDENKNLTFMMIWMSWGWKRVLS